MYIKPKRPGMCRDTGYSASGRVIRFKKMRLSFGSQSPPLHILSIADNRPNFNIYHLNDGKITYLTLKDIKKYNYFQICVSFDKILTYLLFYDIIKKGDESVD